MSNWKRIILLAGAMIVTGLWVRVLAVSEFQTNDEFEIPVASEAVDFEAMYVQKAQAAPPEANEFNKICTSGNGLPVSCSEINEDTMCISLRIGAQSGTRIDCNTDQPIPVDDYGAPGAGGAKYRSPY